ncbi:MAG: tryptophan synthase subunit alpha [Euryarchaeota archaeon]|nr:tryptophan synthase subunit alpha [Euryarchaeota archaeon]
MTRLEEVFSDGRHALITYLMTGDPTLERSRSYAEALVAGGADILELGMPFSDPVADGPTIQRAAMRSLANGTRPTDTFKIAKTLGKAGRAPVVAMGYYNPILQMGLETFASRCRESGIEAAIVPDLPFEEAGPLRMSMESEGLSLVLLASPACDDDRLRTLAKGTSGFLYLVSSYGTTGKRAGLAKETLALVRRAKSICREVGVPLAVGFGVKEASQAAQLVKAGADGVIVGSAIVEMIERRASRSNVTRFAASLKKGIGAKAL